MDRQRPPLVHSRSTRPAPWRRRARRGFSSPSSPLNVLFHWRVVAGARRPLAVGMPFRNRSRATATPHTQVICAVHLGSDASYIGTSPTVAQSASTWLSDRCCPPLSRRRRARWLVRPTRPRTPPAGRPAMPASGKRSRCNLPADHRCRHAWSTPYSSPWRRATAGWRRWWRSTSSAVRQPFRFRRCSRGAAGELKRDLPFAAGARHGARRRRR